MSEKVGELYVSFEIDTKALEAGLTATQKWGTDTAGTLGTAWAKTTAEAAKQIAEVNKTVAQAGKAIGTVFQGAAAQAGKAMSTAFQGAAAQSAKNIAAAFQGAIRNGRNMETAFKVEG